MFVGKSCLKHSRNKGNSSLVQNGLNKLNYHLFHQISRLSFLQSSSPLNLNTFLSRSSFISLPVLKGQHYSRLFVQAVPWGSCLRVSFKGSSLGFRWFAALQRVCVLTKTQMTLGVLVCFDFSVFPLFIFFSVLTWKQQMWLQPPVWWILI